MRRIIETTDAEGIDTLLGERITLFCMNFIYTGTLSGVTTTCVLLTNPAIVYETGPFTDSKWKDAQALPQNLYVMLSAVESFGVMK